MRRGAARPGTIAKRGIDLTIALLGLAALAPSLLLIWLVLRQAVVVIPTRGPSGKVFGRLNFAPEGACGRAMHGAGIDRLPELINVLKGEMSLVGPEPGGDGIPSARPGLATLPQASDVEFVSPLAELRMFVSVLFHRRD